MKEFQTLKSLEISSTDLRIVPSNIEWPTSIENITLFSNGNLETIEPYAFSSAANLKRINLIGSGYTRKDLILKSNAFHTTSSLQKTFELVTSATVIYESNAFGNVDGGQLWDTLDIGASAYGISNGFPEEAFRLLLKSHFDKGHESKYILMHIVLAQPICTHYVF